MSGINFNKDISSLPLKEVSVGVSVKSENQTSVVNDAPVSETIIPEKKDEANITSNSKIAPQPIAIPELEEEDDLGIMGIFYRRDD